MRWLSRKKCCASVTLLTSVLTWAMRQLVSLPTITATDSGLRTSASSGEGIVVTWQLPSAGDERALNVLEVDDTTRRKAHARQAEREQQAQSGI
eukprot:scaffold5493_cov129-Skeletonema_marinoi.AAC.4